MNKRRIMVYEGEKLIYEGPEHRHSPVAVVDPPRFFGLAFRDFVYLIGIGIAILTFYIRTDDTIKELKMTNAYLVTFSKNSDNYHSSATGLPFEQGRPSGYKISHKPLLAD